MLNQHFVIAVNWVIVARFQHEHSPCSTFLLLIVFDHARASSMATFGDSTFGAQHVGGRAILQYPIPNEARVPHYTWGVGLQHRSPHPCPHITSLHLNVFYTCEFEHNSIFLKKKKKSKRS